MKQNKVLGGTILAVITAFIAATFGLAPMSFASTVQVSPQPTVETDAFTTGSGDVADDSAIYADPVNPANSVVIGDNKADSGGGLGVFDTKGDLIHFKQDGKMGNVDLRDNFMLSGQKTVLVGTNNRSNNSIALYKYNTDTRTLTAVHARTISTENTSYGFCLYNSPVNGKFYAFVTPYAGGSIQQFELFDNGSGKVDAQKVRSLPISTITEACVADDGLANFYASQEDVGVWKWGAEPGTGTTKTAVTTVGDGNATADQEGLTIAYGANGAGHLFVSNQNEDEVNVYDRASGNAFIKSFKVAANGTIDAPSHSDGIDVTTKNMGPGFESGMFVTHDETNSGGATSNLKYVPLNRILETGTAPTTPPATTTPTTPVPTPTSTSTSAPVSPNAPKNVRKDPAYTAEPNTTVRYIWDAVSGATTYRHYINGVNVAGEDDSNTGETIIGLTPGTTYEFQVSAVVSGVEYKAAPVTFTTGGGTTPTPTPTQTVTPTTPPATPTPTPTPTATTTTPTEEPDPECACTTPLPTTPATPTPTPTETVAPTTPPATATPTATTPPANTSVVTKVNDSEFVYETVESDGVTAWQKSTNSLGQYGADNYWSGKINDRWSYTFTGTKVEIYGEKGPNLGMVDIEIDDGFSTDANVAVTKDLYAPTRSEQNLIYSSEVLPQGTHTVRVTNSGLKNPASSGIIITADRVDVTSDVANPALGPEAPQNLRRDAGYAGDKTTSAQIQWDAVPNTAFYKHYLDGFLLHGTDDANNSEIVSGLAPGSTHKFQVASYINGAYHISEPFIFTTEAAVSPNAPKNVRKDPAYTTDPNTTVRYIWDAVPNATIYKHYINGVHVAGEDDSNLGETIGGLTAGTTYEFVVSAVVGGIEYKAPAVQFTTGGGTTTPPATPFPTTTATPTPTPTPTSTSTPTTPPSDPNAPGIAPC